MAAAWSGQDPQELAKSWSADSGVDQYESHRNRRSSPEEKNRSRSPPQRDHRPDLVKRATSNQNETVETKPSLQGPSVKRTALNRDNSLASNRLKEQYVPGYRKGGGFNADQAMTQLTENMEQSTLDTSSDGKASPGMLMPALDDAKTNRPHPRSLTRNERMSTAEHIEMDLNEKPVSLTASDRSSTIEALALDLKLEVDPWVRPEPVQRSRTMEEVFSELRDGVARPSSLDMNDRLTTNDFLEIVNEPLVDEDEDTDADMYLSEG